VAEAATIIDLTPAGPEVCCDDPDYGVKGYRFTVAQSFTAYAGEWLLELPAGSTMAARVRDGEGTLLLEGSVAEGDGTEQWYASDFEFTFEAGGVYEVVFFLDAPNDAQFRRKTEDYSGYDVPPYLLDLESRSRSGEEDGPTTTYNSWPPFMRLVLDAPDADGDGVADGDDACPEQPADPPDADGDGCSDPAPDPDTSGDADGGESDGDADDGSSTTPDDPSTSGAPADDGSEGDTGEPASGPAGGSARGCSIGATPGSALLLVMLAALWRRAWAASTASRRRRSFTLARERSPARRPWAAASRSRRARSCASCRFRTGSAAGAWRARSGPPSSRSASRCRIAARR